MPERRAAGFRKSSSEMFNMTRDSRAQENLQERRITHQLRARRIRRPRRQGHHPDYVRISTSNHLLSARTSRLTLRAARIRASEIATTLGTRAPGITTTLGTRGPRITTTLGTRASESTTTLGTRASETYTTLEIGAGITNPTNGLHMRMIEEIA